MGFVMVSLSNHDHDAAFTVGSVSW